MSLAAVTLDDTYTLNDKYARETGRVFITGTQALVRLPMVQKHRDEAAGWHTGGFISGYRGSPLGAYDMALWQAKPFLERGDIRFRPGVNEDLAATAVWGSQQLNLIDKTAYDGVFGIWYGKGPGVDRSGDAFKHANLAGTSARGGVLALLGDDHLAKSSTTAHQSEHAMIHAMIPVLNPAGVQEFLDLGLHGWAMSRFSGCWVSMKCVTETVDSSATVSVDPQRVKIITPQEFAMPEGGLNIRWPDDWLAQEARMIQHKLPAAQAYARANGLDRLVWDGDKARIGILASGKAYLDVRQALEALGLDERRAAKLGIRLYKPALVWPLEPEGARRFAEGLEEIVVVEEKRGLIEEQLKTLLYGKANAPRAIVGKTDETGAPLLPAHGVLNPDAVALVLADRIGRLADDETLSARAQALRARHDSKTEVAHIQRTPYFCSGCPHNTSTRLPEGSRGLAGIGCHFMAQYMDRNTATYTQMGAEGVSWVGQAPFNGNQHVFVNLGDGTYFHSGLMAIRAACASGANMTYKILYNDAVAMTGGQPIDGQISVAEITRQLHAEGIRRIAVVSDEPDKYPLGIDLAPGTTLHHRDDLDTVQRELREVEGVSALVYDQTCASEKRRRRKRGTMADPARRAVINDLVCEGCGDCSVASNCVSVEPLETPFGRKRQINQSTCNKDLSCINGFCPSFVTVEGGRLRRGARASKGGATMPAIALPEPKIPALDRPYGIVITGIGGTGIITVGALLGMAAHIEGRGASVLDAMGAAQKGGPVLSQIKIAARPEDIHAAAIGTGQADLLLGCDLVVAAGRDALSKAGEATYAVVNSHETPVAGFVLNPDIDFEGSLNQRVIAKAIGTGDTTFIEATELAVGLFGDSIGANLFMLGLAYQKGLVPVSAAAIERAIALNGVAIDMNQQAFTWGRRAAEDRAAVTEAAGLNKTAPTAETESLEETIARRVAFLTEYQNAAYAARYAVLVARARTGETERAPGLSGFAEAVARYGFKLMAYKDEYEVARLHTAPAFATKIQDMFEGDFTVRHHLAPPLFASRDPETGHLRKRSFGPWIRPAMRLLAGLRGLRGTPLDIFGYTEERRTERKLVTDYIATIERLGARLDHDSHALAVQIAEIPERIRGFGHIKARHLAEARQKEAALVALFDDPAARAQATAAE